MKKFIFLLLVIVMVMGPLCSATPQKSKQTSADESSESAYDPFFEVTRFIMTKEEIGIYKHLPDQAAREQYAEEFWKKRDPTPETEDNENKEEYEDRIRYATKWFQEHSKGRGWDTERGRILLQLGFPDRREFGEAEDIVRTGRNRGSLMSSKPIPMEKWFYLKYQMLLVFMDQHEKGRLELVNIPTILPRALEEAKFSMDLRDRQSLKYAFKFDVAFNKDHFQVTIPTKKVSFEEKDGKMNIDFNIMIYVYKDSKKFDEVKIPKAISLEKEELLGMKKIEFSIPYEVSAAGKYYIEVVIEEKSSGSKFRDFVDFKI